MVWLDLVSCVVYWPTTRPGCQNRKCTCVNNWCIWSRNSRENLDRGWDEWVQFVTPTRRRWVMNYYISQCTGNSIRWRRDAEEKASTQQRGPSDSPLISWGSDELEIRCGRENQHPERLGPNWAAQENGKEMQLWPIEWGSIYCCSVRSPTPSHTQPFQIKWEVYFSKNCVASLHCVEYATPGPLLNTLTTRPMD